MRRLFLHILSVICLCSPIQLRAVENTLPTDSNFTNLLPERYPVSAETLPLFTTQIEITLPESTNSLENIVRLEYPEFAPLSSEETKTIRQANHQVPDSITLQADYGISRKKGILDVSFCPVIRKGGTYYRLISCKLAVNHTIGRTALSATSNPGNRWAEKSVMATGRWVKIRVSAEGIYRLSSTDLKAMGFQDISRVKLYGYGGRLQPEAWTFNGHNRIPDDLNEVPLYRRKEDVLFCAEGTVRWTWNTARQQWYHENQPYSRYSYYFLTEGNNPAGFSTLRPNTISDNIISSVTAYTVYDNDAASFYNGGREMYDAYNFSTGNSKTYKLQAPGAIAGENAIVAVGIAASNSMKATAVELSVNDNRLAQFNISRHGSEEIAREARQYYKTKAITDNNIFSIQTSQGSSARLNYLRVTYQRALSATDDGIAFTPNMSGAATLQIANATGNTAIWQIGTADLPTTAIESKLSGTTLHADIDDASQRFVVVDLNKDYPAPTIVGEVDNQNLHADHAADMVIIIPASNKLKAPAKRLAEFHRGRGLRVNVVQTSELYNEFSSGTPDASAYRRYLKMLYDRAKSPHDIPRYLLLFGNSAWDNRMLSAEWQEKNPDDYLLAFEVSDGAREAFSADLSIGNLRSYVTDDFFGWLDDNEGTNYNTNKLDIAIGRFTCTETSEANVLVDKTIAYVENKTPGAWQNRVYFLADDLNNTLHMRSAETTINYFNKATSNRFSVRKIYWDAYKRTYTATGYAYPEVRKLLQDYMSQGALMLNYTGHGSPDQISYARILLKEDFNISSEGRLPLWVMASCEISPFDSDKEDIGRNALSNPSGGAIAVMCATRSVYADRNEILNNYYCTYLFEKDSEGRHNSVSEALRRAKVALVETGGDATTNKLKYVLLGDPSVVLAAPHTTISVDSINGEAIAPNRKWQMKAGEKVRFAGHVNTEAGEKDKTFNGTVTATLTDRLETIICQNNSKGENVMTYQDRTKILFEGSDSVHNGLFSISFVVPRDINYSKDNGRITLYAVNDRHTIEANGENQQFYFNGTETGQANDTIAPKVYLYLDAPNFPDGGITSSSPVFFARVSDNIGLNVTGNSIGHNIELILDNNTADAITLNSHFIYDFGSYSSGTVSYPLNNLTSGPHHLKFRVWDVNNNVSTSSLSFHVGDQRTDGMDINATSNPAYNSTNFVTILPEEMGGNHTVTTDVWDINGRKVWSTEVLTGGRYCVVPWNLSGNDGAPLPSGIYLYRAKVSETGVSSESSVKKLIIIRK